MGAAKAATTINLSNINEGFTVIGSTTAADVITGSLNGNDTITGGSAADTFNIGSGTDSITNRGYGADILAVSSGATANVTVYTTGWTAAATSSNNGIVNLSTNGYSVNLSKVTGTGIWNITDSNPSTTADTLTASTAIDNFNLTGTGNDTIVFAKGISSATAATYDTITGLHAGDVISYTASVLTVGLSNQASGAAYVQFDASGNAAFLGATPTTLAAAENEILAAFKADGGVKAGEFAAFNLSGKEYLFIVSTANETTASASDTLIQLVGVTALHDTVASASHNLTLV
jgi:Ca2+-binding RTX toxin-like protein